MILSEAARNIFFMLRSGYEVSKFLTAFCTHAILQQSKRAGQDRKEGVMPGLTICTEGGPG
jgi:hypothetical protein